MTVTMTQPCLYTILAAVLLQPAGHWLALSRLAIQGYEFWPSFLEVPSVVVRSQLANQPAIIGVSCDGKETVY